MIPEDHLPAVKDCCDRIIWVAWHTNASVTEMYDWIRECLREDYDYEVD